MIIQSKGEGCMRSSGVKEVCFLCNAVGLGFMHRLISVHTNLLQIHVFTQKCLLIIFTESLPLKANSIRVINDTFGSALD